MKISRLIPIILLIAVSLLINCEDKKHQLSAEVHILSTFKSNYLQNGSANIRYQIENTSDVSIRGWNIYFRVSMASGKQVQAFDGLTYSLEPGEISDKLIATGAIPVHFDGVDQPTTASLQLIELY